MGNSLRFSVVGNCQVTMTRYLPLVRLLRQGTFHLRYFLLHEVCNSWTPYLLSFSSRMIDTSRLVMTAIPSSNATVNVTISSGGIQIWSLFDSSLGTVTIVNLPSNLVLVAVTYMPSDDPALFGLQSFIVTAPANE